MLIILDLPLDAFGHIVHYSKIDIRTFVSLALASRGLRNLCMKYADGSRLWDYGYGLGRRCTLVLSNSVVVRRQYEATRDPRMILPVIEYDVGDADTLTFAARIIDAFACYCGNVAWDVLANCYCTKYCDYCTRLVPTGLLVCRRYKAVRGAPGWLSYQTLDICKFKCMPKCGICRMKLGDSVFLQTGIPRLLKCANCKLPSDMSISANDYVESKPRSTVMFRFGDETVAGRQIEAAMPTILRQYDPLHPATTRMPSTELFLAPRLWEEFNDRLFGTKEDISDKKLENMLDDYYGAIINTSDEWEAPVFSLAEKDAHLEN